MRSAAGPVLTRQPARAPREQRFMRVPHRDPCVRGTSARSGGLPLGRLPHGLVDNTLFTVLFVVLTVTLLVLLGDERSSFYLLAVLAAAVLTEGVAAHHHRRQARAARDRVAARFGMEPGTEGTAAARRTRKGSAPLVGRHHGRTVEVMHGRADVWRGKFRSYLWFIRWGAFMTQIATPARLPADVHIKLERRKSLERTETRIDTAPGQERTWFEKGHHLFSSDETVARRLLDADLQMMITALGHYNALRIEDGQVSLTFDTIAGPDPVRHGLDIVTEIARRIEAEGSGQDP